MARTCEDYRALDLAVMQQRKWLKPGLSGKLTWSTDGEQTGAIEYRVEERGLRVIYKASERGEGWQSIDEVIPFCFTPMNFGGRRRWFACPSCQRRVRILYQAGVRFRCRACYRLQYESQYENAFQRALSQQRKLRARIACDDIDEEFPPKPKGMHWMTYRWLEARDEALDRRSIMSLAVWLESR